MKSLSLRHIVTCKALPDEVAAGHAGRSTFLNDYPRSSYFFDTVRVLVLGPLRHLSCPDITLLATLNGQGTAVYAAKHSMLPLMCFPLSRRGWNPLILQHYGMLPGRPFAYLCVDCAVEDVAARGFSHWHRTHQIVGRFHCAKHPSIRLVKVVGQDRPFERCPLYCVDRGLTVVPVLHDTRNEAQWRLRLVDIEQRILDLSGEYSARQKRPLGDSMPRFRKKDAISDEVNIIDRVSYRDLDIGSPRSGPVLPPASGLELTTYLANEFSSAVDALNACDLAHIWSGRPYRVGSAQGDLTGTDARLANF